MKFWKLGDIRSARKLAEGDDVYVPGYEYLPIGGVTRAELAAFAELVNVTAAREAAMPSGGSPSAAQPSGQQSLPDVRQILAEFDQQELEDEIEELEASADAGPVGGLDEQGEESVSILADSTEAYEHLAASLRRISESDPEPAEREAAIAEALDQFNADIAAALGTATPPASRPSPP